MTRRVVCAALRHRDGRVLAGVRHFCPVMQPWFMLDPWQDWADAEQGFIDNQYQFVTREEAWKIAEAAGQILPNAPHRGLLFSEDLY